MAAILQLRRGISNASASVLSEGELYLHQGTGSIQFGSGSNTYTLLPLNTPINGNINLVGNISASSLNLTGNATVAGNISFGGGLITLGDDSGSDNIVIVADLSSSIIPNNNNTFDLGASDKKWKNLYATSISGAIAATNGVISGSSQITSILDSLNTFSGSQLTQNIALATISGSLISSASTAKTTNDSQDVSITNLNTNSASVNISVAALNLKTGSYATTGSNIFIGNQTITGSLTISGSSTFRNIGPTILSGSVLVSGSINSDGIALDATATTNIPALNTSFNSDFSSSASTFINKSLVLGDGKVLVAGRFESVDGHTTNDIARFNSNGTIDTSFSSPVFSTTIEGDTGGLINTFVTQSDGKIIVGGTFTRVSGAARVGLARLDTNGTLDATFATQSLSSFGEVRDIAIQNDNKIVFVGNFTSGSRRINTDGTIDTSLIVSTSPGFGDDDFHSVALLNSGSGQAILIGGNFQQWNSFSDYHHLVKLHPSGALDFGFAGTNLDIATGNSLDRIQKIKVTDAYTAGDNGYIYIAGRFKDTLAGPNVRHAGFARLTTVDEGDGIGAFDSGFRTYISGSDQNLSGVTVYVNDFDFYDSNKILLGGNFITFGIPGYSTTSANRFAIIDQNDGSLISGWSASGSASTYNLNTGSVNSVTLIPSTTNVLVGGTFTSASSLSTAREGLASLKLAGLGNVTTTSEYTITANINELLISSSNTYFTGNITASVISASFVGNGSGLTGVTAGNIEFANILNKPTLISGSSQILGGSGIFSGSSQVNADSITNFDSNVKEKLNADTVVSGSSQIDATATTNFNSGIKTKLNSETVVSGSSQITITSTTGFTDYSGSVSASLNILSSSINLDLARIHESTSSLNLYTQSLKQAIELTGSSVTILGNLTVAGTTTAVNSTIIQLGDNIIELNGTGVANGGLLVKDPTGASLVSGSLLWDSGNDYWKAGKLGNESKILLADGMEIVSSSAQIKSLLPNGTVSGSSQITPLLPTGTISGSTQIANLGYATTGSNTFNGNMTLISSSNIILRGPGDDGISGSGDIIWQDTYGNEMARLWKSADNDSLTVSFTGSHNSYVFGTLIHSLNLKEFGDDHFILTSSLNSYTSSQDTKNSTLGTYSGSINDKWSTLQNVTASLINATSSYETNGRGIVSGSSQVTTLLPNGVVSGSSQVTYSDISSISVGIVSGSSQVTPLLPTGVVSGSSQVVYSDLSSIPAGIVSGSSQIPSLLPTGVVSGSNQLSSSYNLLYAPSASFATLLGANTLASLGSAAFYYVTSSADIALVSGSINYINNHLLTAGATKKYIDWRTDEILTAIGAADITAVNAGNGLSGGGISGDVTLTLDTGSAHFTNGVDARLIPLTSLNSYTSSQDTKNTTLATYTSSLDTKNSTLATYTASVSSQLSNLNQATSSYETKGRGIVSGSSQITFSGISSLPTLVSGSSQITYANISSIPAGIVSGSTQVTPLLPIGVVSGSSQILGGTGIVSGSSQITYASISSIPSGIVSGSSQVTPLLPTGIVSGSSQVTPLLPTGIVSGSSQITYTSISSIPAGIISGSSQLSGTTITDLTIVNLTTVNETASVIFSSGSNRFGDFGNDIHSFTGSVQISGSLTTIGDSTATSFNGVINATNGVISGSSQLTATLPSGVVSGSSQIILLLPSGVVSGSSQVTRTLQQITDTGASTSNAITISNATASTTKTTGALIVTGGIGVSGDINAGGDIVAFASSDIRLKNNIRPIQSPLEKISKISGCEFDWNADLQSIYSGKDYGVIAQEIEEVFPELVQTRENGYKAVKYDKLVSVLIEGIKELTKQVEYLKTKIEN